EDGIRDFHVTGVQTCALPISARVPRTTSSMYALTTAPFHGRLVSSSTVVSITFPNCVDKSAARRGRSSFLLISRPSRRNQVPVRSEERRVGNDGGGCRSGGPW